MLRKLHAGEPVTVLTVGSSVVAGTHGNFYLSREAVYAAGARVLTQSMDGCRGASGNLHPGNNGPCSAPGSAQNLMAFINETWPHPGHVLINHGIDGAALEMFLHDACSDPMLPHTADLLLFESHVDDATCARCDTEHFQSVGLERLHHRLAHRLRPGAHPVPLVIMSYLWVSDPQDFNGSWDVGLSLRRCRIVDWRHRLESSLRARSLEDAVSAAAAYYGWSAVSLRNAMWAGLRDGLMARMNLSSVCEYASVFQADQIHPSGAGARLMGDALVWLLNASRAVFYTAAPDARAPTTPLTPGAWAGVHSLCTDAKNFALLPAQSVQNWTWVPGEDIRSKAGNATRYVAKPGLVAHADGAEVALALSTRIARAPRNATVTLLVHYLTSYEQMGDAVLSCTASCVCEPTRLPGTVTENFSVTTTAAVTVTQARRCVLHFVVHATPTGSKFKITRLEVQFSADGDALYA